MASARILVVDEDPPAVRAMAQVLQQAGYAVFSAVTGREALEQVREHRPHLVLLGGELTDIPGSEVLETIRADPSLQSVTTVLLEPPQPAAGQRAAALETRADDHIARPIASEELLARVRLHLRQRELAKQLRDSEARFLTLTDHLPDLVFTNRDGRIVYVNPAGVQILKGTSASDILGRSPFDFIHPDFHALARERIAQARKQPAVMPLREFRFIALDGTEIDVEVHAVSCASGVHIDIHVLARDITARKQVEAERQGLLAMEQAARQAADEASRHYRALFESAPGCYLVLTPQDHTIVAVSDAYLRATMTRREALSGRTIFDAFWGPDQGRSRDVEQELRKSLARVARERRADVMAVQLYPVTRPEQDGGGLEDRYWSPVNSPVFGPRGEIEYIIHRVEDVTEYLSSQLEFSGLGDARQLLASQTRLMEADVVLRGREISQARQELEESQALMRMASHLSHFGAWSIDLATQEVTWSDEVFEIHEVPKGTVLVVEQGIEFFAPEHRDTLRAAFEACARQGTPYDLELQIISTTGRRVWVRTMAEAVRDDTGAIVRVQGAFQDISERKATEAEVRGLQGRLAAMIEQIGEGFMTLDGEWRITYVNGAAERILGDTRASLLNKNFWEAFPAAAGTAFEEAQQRAARERTPVGLVEYYAPLDLWADTRIYPTEEGLAIYFRDVSRERALEESARQFQRMEAVGQLTGGVAHDFNNLLTIILGNAELLHEQVAERPRLAPLAAMISSAAQRGASLTRSLLAFARRQALEPGKVDLRHLVSDMVPLLQGALGENIEIELHAGAEVVEALVDPAQLESALLNLCLNARDAMPGGGTLTIEISSRELDADYSSMHADVTPGHYVMVAVSDTGSGIAAEDLPRVCEPFFTTKEKGKGTGLGLSMVYGFIKQSGGQMNIDSKPGEGTTVEIYLPCAIEGDARPDPVVAGPVRARGTETILLVEDDELVRRYAHDQLAALGYTVASAANGPEALQIVQEREDIDLLFTDIVMPGGMNGRQLADAVRTLRPGMKVLYTSGYTDDAVTHHGRLDPGVQLLSKPYGRGDLAARIRHVLDQA